LSWSKDAKSGRTLEQAPLFSDGTYVYTVSLQKYTHPEGASTELDNALVVEKYDPQSNFEFVSHIMLY